ncbi:hypothetical protein ACFL5O_04370 [Myxococcota bacterium]
MKTASINWLVLFNACLLSPACGNDDDHSAGGRVPAGSSGGHTGDSHARESGSARADSSGAIPGGASAGAHTDAGAGTNTAEASTDGVVANSDSTKAEGGDATDSGHATSTATGGRVPSTATLLRGIGGSTGAASSANSARGGTDTNQGRTAAGVGGVASTGSTVGAGGSDPNAWWHAFLADFCATECAAKAGLDYTEVEPTCEDDCQKMWESIRRGECSNEEVIALLQCVKENPAARTYLCDGESLTVVDPVGCDPEHDVVQACVYGF